jgi:adenine-specific DNA-methyltransferase
MTKQGNYSELSVKLTNDISKKDKKESGIYFTPPDTIKKNIDAIKSYLSIGKDSEILEPACGSCEFILALQSEFPKTSITGIELNNTIYNSIKKYSKKKVKINQGSFLSWDSDKLYDLVIGNPPYFVENKNDIDKRFHSFFDGRPNIFIPFIIKSLNLLKDGGILSFVLPTSFMSCLYYDKTREEINKHKILNIMSCTDKYIETQQDTVIVIIQKVEKKDSEDGDDGKDGEEEMVDNSKFIVKKNGHTIFGIEDDITKIKELYEGAKSLSELGFKVNVGTVVWNQCKDILTDDNSKTRLIYSSDINGNKLRITEFRKPEYEFIKDTSKKDKKDEKMIRVKKIDSTGNIVMKETDKKNYIDKEGSNSPLLVVNRGYGVGKYKLEYCLIEEPNYLIENHLICIKCETDKSKRQLVALYKKIMKSLSDKKTEDFIKLYFGNSAVNTTELNHILPIYGM